jgi:hypothetical protein
LEGTELAIKWESRKEVREHFVITRAAAATATTRRRKTRNRK